MIIIKVIIIKYQAFTTLKQRRFFKNQCDVITLIRRYFDVTCNLGIDYYENNASENAVWSSRLAAVNAY